MAQRTRTLAHSALTVGIDVGDERCALCWLDADGTVLEESWVRTRATDFQRRFGAEPPLRVVLEVGMHSPWLSRLLEALGHEVIVANPRRVHLIARSDRKHDRADAESLARLGRLDPALLAPVRHRGPRAQADLAVLRARDVLVRNRTALINHVRGSAKALGTRLRRASAESFHRQEADHLPAPLRPALAPLLAQLEQLTAAIRAYDARLEALCAASPETAALRRVRGVGPVTALAFVLTLADPGRFARSRDVGPYLGLVPRQRQSSGHDPAAAHLQGRRRVPATPPRGLRALHPRALRRGLRPAPLGPRAGRVGGGPGAAGSGRGGRGPTPGRAAPPSLAGRGLRPGPSRHGASRVAR